MKKTTVVSAVLFSAAIALPAFAAPQNATLENAVARAVVQAVQHQPASDIKALNAAYKNFINYITAQQVKKEKDIIKNLASFIETYNAFAKEKGDAYCKQHINGDLFETPFDPGWGVHLGITLKDLVQDLSFRPQVGMRSPQKRTAAILQEDFKVSAEEAQLFASFAQYVLQDCQERANAH